MLSKCLLPFFISLITLLLVSCGTETETTPTYTLTISVVGQGTVTPSGGEYEAGETVTLIANPSEGWTFIEWNGDLTGNESPQQISIDGDKNIIAVFGPILMQRCEI